jgi:hypothetical protein
MSSAIGRRAVAEMKGAGASVETARHGRNRGGLPGPLGGRWRKAAIFGHLAVERFPALF